ncbi:hypothetical protein SASPL_128727 [Salvia splendens]|uniref:E3 ubiquitin-protein ligase RNF144 n=1 Tax=Salvia splendens TaxID=180675 RepID=A0A8X8XD09_SALSN|nr:hypothetical protein SASPL_128727 [Salvia splendens]
MFPLPAAPTASATTASPAIVDAAAAIACPGTGCGVAACRAVLPAGVLCEAAITVGDHVYCPYKNCSALLVDDGGAGVIAEAECPFCRRCNVAPWHAGVDCEGFAKLGKDEREGGDLMVHDLAKSKKWRRCPGCNFYVERNEGCLHITCRLYDLKYVLLLCFVYLSFPVSKIDKASTGVGMSSAMPVEKLGVLHMVVANDSSMVHSPNHENKFSMQKI